jgi:hypothetical protein
MQYRSVRRRSGIALYKNNFSAEDGQSKAEAIQNRPARRFLSQVKKLVQHSNGIFAICNSTLLLLH